MNDLDDLYRRASSGDPSRPSETVRRAVFERAAAVAARGHRVRRRRAAYGALAMAGIAGLLILPRVFGPQPPSATSGSASVTAASDAAAPTGGSTPAAPVAPAKPVAPAAASRARSGATRAPVQKALGPADVGAALRRAAATGDLPGLQAALDHAGVDVGVDVDARDAQGRTALLLAARHGQTPSVDWLLAHGADPDAADGSGLTPMQAAVIAHHPAIVAALRRAGARAAHRQ